MGLVASQPARRLGQGRREDGGDGGGGGALIVDTISYRSQRARTGAGLAAAAPARRLAASGSASARGTFQPCSLLAVVSIMSFVTVLVMVHLQLDSNQRVYLQQWDSNLLVHIGLYC